MENLARSVVDNRQPFFRNYDGTIITVEEKIKLENGIHKNRLFVDELNGKCFCWRCNKS